MKLTKWMKIALHSFLQSMSNQFHFIILRLLIFDQWPLSKTEFHSMIYDCKILNLWTNKQCFEIIHSLLVFVFDKVSKSKLSRFTSQYSLCNLQNAICSEKPRLCRNERNKSYIFLRETSRRQSSLFVYETTPKIYRMPKSYHLLKLTTF